MLEVRRYKREPDSKQFPELKDHPSIKALLLKKQTPIEEEMASDKTEETGRESETSVEDESEDLPEEYPSQDHVINQENEEDWKTVKNKAYKKPKAKA